MKTTVNFRDLGGLKGYGGKTVKPGKILRGAQLYELSQQEKEEFCRAYDIRTIIDLRNGDYSGREPNGEIPGVQQHLFEVIKTLVDLEEEHPARGDSAKGADNFFRDYYAKFVHDAHAGNCFRDILNLFAEGREGAIYFHCVGGKDRTGIMAALVLTVLGVSEEEIIKDFLRSIELRREENERYMKMMRTQGKTEGELEAQAVFLTVERVYIENFIRSAEEAFGSVEGYIREGLGVRDEVFVRMRELYLD